ncbi:MAG: cysteine--tRNA ligase [bacterium]|nr:cysteine--tRNA ligase [bacterium]
MPLTLYNTLSREKEVFIPIDKDLVSFYACGPTVYNYAHIGNLRTYIFEDIVRRALQYNGFSVRHVMNITDVGHLTDDADAGEDKVEVEAQKSGKSANDIAEFYTNAFKKDLADLNILEPVTWPKATEQINEQITLIQKLEDKGYIYQTSDGVYFDTSKFKHYGRLARLNLKGQQEGARVVRNEEKKNPTDFALWKFSPKDQKRQMEWESPWGTGFPGWHIECSAMSMKELGETIDIHAGGIDHIPVHHTNEIAQSEAATGKKFVNYWLHGEFLLIDKGRMGKSEGNLITLETLKEKGFSPLAYRYFVLQAHYRTKLNFSWEAIEAAQSALDRLCERVSELGKPIIGCAEYEQKFLDAINDDLNTPQALAVVWDMLKSDNPPAAKQQSIQKFDRVLGLGLDNVIHRPTLIPKTVQKLVSEREEARANNEWEEADRLRDKIEKAGFDVEDTAEGSKLKKQ